MSTMSSVTSDTSISVYLSQHHPLQKTSEHLCVKIRNYQRSAKADLFHPRPNLFKIKKPETWNLKLETWNLKPKTWNKKAPT